MSASLSLHVRSPVVTRPPDQLAVFPPRSTSLYAHHVVTLGASTRLVQGLGRRIRGPTPPGFFSKTCVSPTPPTRPTARRPRRTFHTTAHPTHSVPPPTPHQEGICPPAGGVMRTTHYCEPMLTAARAATTRLQPGLGRRCSREVLCCAGAHYIELQYMGI